MDWFLLALKKYATFSGRSRRKEYWMFTLFYIIFAIGVAILDAILGSPGVLGAILALGLFLPSLSVAVRRLHDTGRSGWWFLIAFLPIIGFFVLLYFMVQEGHAGDNAYGANPKMADVERTNYTSPMASAPVVAPRDVAAELGKLDELRAKGALNQEEFDVQKRKILA